MVVPTKGHGQLNATPIRVPSTAQNPKASDCEIEDYPPLMSFVPTSAEELDT